MSADPARTRFQHVASQRCQARSPGGSTKAGQLPQKGTQCGLYAKHGGAHTSLIPTSAPWFPRITND